MRPVSLHTAAWRYPGAWPDANFNFQHLKRFAQTLERGRFDAFFMADHLAVLNMPIEGLKRSATVTSFDPLTLLPALAVVTAHLGLIATASTTYNEPYHLARKFASLDHISGGRAGWNVVTSGNPHEAMNFGREEHVAHATRYRRAREVFDVVTGLWDSWADDAFIRDVETGVYFDSAFVGTPLMADQMEEWLLTDACDGFNVMFPYLPGGRYVIIGQLGAQEVSFAPRFFVEKQLTVMGVLSGATAHYYKALQFLQLNRDRFHFEDMLSNRYRLDQINEAMAAMHAFREIKPVVILSVKDAAMPSHRIISADDVATNGMYIGVTDVNKSAVTYTVFYEECPDCS